MSSQTVYAITGANRGIGLGLTLTYLTRPSTTVVGIVRSAAAAQSLKRAVDDLADRKPEDSILHVVVVEIAGASSPDPLREVFEAATGSSVAHVNVLICCAGMAPALKPTVSITAQDLRDAVEVNAIGPLLAFQGLWGHLSKSHAVSHTPPKFIVLSSSVGSIGAMEPFPGGAYGPSKATVNHLIRSLHLQMAGDGLVSVALHPGFVQTDMGKQAAKEWGVTSGPPLSVEESVKAVVGVIDGATRENVSGRFVTQDGQEISW